ncbi:unnamed protein product [Albugo candida]|uniref:Uncharacterized protein n=1 Tax=Albugo candida TaxID=65357 RepID=A0A024G8F8_9STRA|nr:unnamed protein product [Albugo candida]|eukprot:CCI42924.1 unnamed protein product [Albugo candida]
MVVYQASILSLKTKLLRSNGQKKSLWHVTYSCLKVPSDRTRSKNASSNAFSKIANVIMRLDFKQVEALDPELSHESLREIASQIILYTDGNLSSVAILAFAILFTVGFH